MTERAVTDHQAASEATVFDRGLPDMVAYARYLGVPDGDAVATARRRRYDPRALIAEPWEDIYVTDDERMMTFEQVTAFHEAVVSAYADLGYQLITIPRRPIDSRVRFIEDFMQST